MHKIILITRPRYDDGTEYLAYYAGLVVKQARNSRIEVKDFDGESANKQEITKFIKKKDPLMLFINGHGDNDTLYGNKDEVIFSLDNVGLLKDKIIYARACSAGAELGKKAVEQNSGCFIGYQLPFLFWIDSRWSAKPSNDKTAKLYLEPSNEIVISLIKGKSCAEAHEKSKRMMVSNMRKLLRMEEKKEPGAMGMLQALWTNYDGQVLHGNADVCIG